MRGRHVLNVVLWLVVIMFHELHKADLSEAVFCYFIPEDFFDKVHFICCPYCWSYVIRAWVNYDDSVFINSSHATCFNFRKHVCVHEEK